MPDVHKISRIESRREELLEKHGGGVTFADRIVFDEQSDMVLRQPVSTQSSDLWQTWSATNNAR